MSRVEQLKKARDMLVEKFGYEPVKVVLDNSTPHAWFNSPPEWGNGNSGACYMGTKGMASYVFHADDDRTRQLYELECSGMVSFDDIHWGGHRTVTIIRVSENFYAFCASPLVEMNADATVSVLFQSEGSCGCFRESLGQTLNSTFWAGPIALSISTYDPDEKCGFVDGVLRLHLPSRTYHTIKIHRQAHMDLKLLAEKSRKLRARDIGGEVWEFTKDWGKLHMVVLGNVKIPHFIRFSDKSLYFKPTTVAFLSE